MAARKRGAAKKSRSRTQTTKVAGGKGRKTGKAVSARKTPSAKRSLPRRRAGDVVGPSVDTVEANGIRR